MSCKWIKKGTQYHTDCNRISKIRGRGWEYCPYCGEMLDLDRREYQAAYYQKEKKRKKYEGIEKNKN